MNNIAKNNPEKTKEKTTSSQSPEEKKAEDWLEKAEKEQVTEAFSPLLETIDHLPQWEPSIEEVEKSIDKTVIELEMQEWSAVSQLVEWMKEKKTLWEKLSYLLSNLGKLFSAFLSISWWWWGQEVASKLVAYNELDYTQYDAEELWWDIDPKSLPTVQNALKENTYPEGSMLHELIEKIKSSDSVQKRLAWTAAYTNAMTVYKRKSENPNFSFTDYEALSWAEKIKGLAKPWDLIVLWSWWWGPANAALRNVSMGNEHVLMVGNDWEMYHSTMSKWENGKGWQWFEKRNLSDLLDKRAPVRMSIIRPAETVDVNAMIKKGEELVTLHNQNPSEYKYSNTDAVTSLVADSTVNNNSMNCGKFVWNCLLAWWYQLPKDSGDPSTYFDEKWFSIEYFGAYEK